MTDQKIDTLVGMQSLRQWLEERGFHVYRDGLKGPLNACNWYACRRTGLLARECETNNGKRMQIVVHPHKLAMPDRPDDWESVEVNVTGECGGVWFRLLAYSLTVGEFKRRLPEIEAMLIRAWNALAGQDKMREALELIAAPQRADGTWNRDREACRQLAVEALQ